MDINVNDYTIVDEEEFQLDLNKSIDDIIKEVETMEGVGLTKNLDIVDDNNNSINYIGL